MRETSSDGRQLLKKLLRVKPNKSLAMTVVLQQPWMCDAKILEKVKSTFQV